jgi:hypothetical protein
MKTLSMAALTLLLCCACADPSAEGPAGSFITKGVPPDVASAEARWNESGITDYTMDVTIGECFCPGPMEYSVTVVDGQVTEHTSPSVLKHPEALTVERLFHWLSAWGPDAVEATFNGYGVPIEADVDAPNVADEQAHYVVTFEAT